MTSTFPLVIEKLSKSYTLNDTPAVDEISLEVQKGELLTFLGPSGCGKTTILRLIAGLERENSGKIIIDGKDVTYPFISPEKRQVGLVFQDYALFPHLNVFKNVLFGLSHLPKSERQKRAEEMISLVGLTVFSSRMPHELSGGQQQRVALARALAPLPKILLLDEPFSNLDAQLRHNTRQEIRTILKKTGTTAILVTHDQEEALSFSDRIVVIRTGKIEQIDTPYTVYTQPSTAFVANFLGRSNLISGMAQNTYAESVLGNLPIESPAHGSITLCLRPEQLALFLTQEEATKYQATTQPTAQPTMPVPAVVLGRDFKGRDTHYIVQVNKEEQQQELQVYDPKPPLYHEGQQVWIQVISPARVLSAS